MDVSLILSQKSFLTGSNVIPFSLIPTTRDIWIVCPIPVLLGTDSSTDGFLRSFQVNTYDPNSLALDWSRGKNRTQAQPVLLEFLNIKTTEISLSLIIKAIKL